MNEYELRRMIGDLENGDARLDDLDDLDIQGDDYFSSLLAALLELQTRRRVARDPDGLNPEGTPCDIDP